MSRRISRRLARNVRERADDICEYCLLSQDSQEATFHVDHIVPLSHGGATTLDNLALECVTCSLRKAARHRARDPRTGRLVSLYYPRAYNWTEHFALTQRWRVRGRSRIGRATIEALSMNRPTIIEIRRELSQSGRYPPDVG